MIRASAALALVYVLAHLPFLAPSLEDIDSVNFALGVRDFDVARHRPHPPGYPVYIALAKAAVGVAGLFDGAEADAGRSRLEARAMSMLSLVSAGVASVLLYCLFACLSRAGADRVSAPWRSHSLTGSHNLPGSLDPRALAATAVAVACPLFWYMSVRPMSDVPGLAAALAAIACLALAWWRQQPGEDGDRRLSPDRMAASGRMIVLGALLSAIAIGFRSQNAMLTLPLLLLVLVDRIGRGVAGAMIGGGVALAAGGLLWAIPLVAASGGLGAYLAALGTQAGEDFAGVDMLYLNLSPRLAADALLRTLIYPWDSLILGSIVLVFAAIGLVSLALRDRRSLIALLAVGGPYLVFHLLFHDMSFVRYALPLVPPVAYLAVCGLEWSARRAALPMAGALTIWGVAIASPVLARYSAEPSPTVRALQAMETEQPQTPLAVLGMHQTFERPLEAERVRFRERLPSPPRREWLELVRYWREGNVAPVWFLADPRRTDLLLIDPASRRDRRDFAWRFSSLSEIGGLRPAAAAWYRMTAPGWCAEEGWALSPESAGIARVMGRGPHLGPITAWVRRRSPATRLLVGGRHLGGPNDPAVTFTAALDEAVVATWEARPGFFLHVFDLPRERLAGPDGLSRLDITSAAQGGRIPTAIEQFDFQNAGTLMWGYDTGWHEAEYNPRFGVWRWTSDRATLRIVEAQGPVTIRLQIESPLRYFESAPTVRMMAGGQVLAETRPTGSDVWEVVVPLDRLTAAQGLVTIETDRTFVPAERGGPPDHRRLGLRVFAVDVAVRN